MYYNYLVYNYKHADHYCKTCITKNQLAYVQANEKIVHLGTTNHIYNCGLAGEALTRKKKTFTK